MKCMFAKVIQINYNKVFVSTKFNNITCLIFKLYIALYDHRIAYVQFIGGFSESVGSCARLAHVNSLQCR